MTVSATVRHLDLEGGFWGLETEDGARYRPVGELPAAVQNDGLRVEATVEKVQMVGLAQWGEAVDVVAIRPV